MNSNENNIITDEPQIKPWARYFARIVDYTIFGVILGIMFNIIFPKTFDEMNDKIFGYILLILWIIPESLFLHFIGTTPGKALFKTTVFDLDKKKLSFNNALKRSGNVWLKGMGLGIPIITIITMISSYNKLTGESTTKWDKNIIKVHHEQIGKIRYIIITLIFTVIFCSFIYNIISVLKK
jgi:hypothetical protein